MSSPYSNPRQLSYANIAAGTIARGGRSITPSQYPNTASYAHLPYPTAVPRFQVPPQEESAFVRADMEDDDRHFASSMQRRDNTGRRRMIRDRTSQYSENQSFFTPSYLTRSRHVQRLKQEYEERAEASHSKSDTLSRIPDLSTNSSSTDLHKTCSSSPGLHLHRAVAQHVIERTPPSFELEDKPRALPSQWSELDKAGGLEIQGDGSEVRFGGVQLKNTDEAASLRTDNPIPKEVGLYYYEVTIMSKGKDASVGVGFAGKKTNLSRLPGWESDSYAYHGDDGDTFAGASSGRPYGPRFSSHDVIGCGVNYRTNSIFFTKNGVFLGVAFPDIKITTLYPCVGLKKPTDHLRVNFGRMPFVYDIDTMMEQERQIVLKTIHREDVSKLHPPDDEPTLIQNLIGQYLAHEGYVETSRAFQQDLRARKRLAPSTSSQSSIQHNDEDDVHASNRQRIRRAILHGDVDRALKYTQSYYPLVLKNERNMEIYFRLRCRKFIEMMRRYSDLSSATTLAKSMDLLSGNGHDSNGNQQDTQMELDDQLQREATRDQEPADDVDMDASTDFQTSSIMKEGDLLGAAIEYGQALRAEFDADSTPSVKKELNDIFALMAYQDPRTSPVGYLLDKSGRSSIAEELNGAILVSMGKPSSAALEKLCSQTEQFLDDVATKNGSAAAFINVQQDFLRP